MSFVHLHSHSEYSMLDGASRVSQMFDRAKELGMPALALTDHGVMYGAIPFYQAGRRAGVRPIIGMEAYVAPGARFDRPAANEDSYYHLTVLAASEKGYRNLMSLSSLGFLEGFDARSRRPRLDKELLDSHSEGIVVLSGCLSGELNRSLTKSSTDAARKVAAEYREIFGDRYFLEVQNQGLEVQPALNAQIAQISADMSIPLVATNDSHYTHKDDAEAHDILLCIQTGKELSDTKRMRFDTDQFYLKSPDEMKAAFTEYPEAVENSLRVAELCNHEIELDQMLLPHFDVPDGESLDSYLHKLTEDGLRRRYPEPSPEVQARSAHELKVIENTGYAGYFLIVADFVGWAKQQGIRVGPGRGSAGGSIVAYALGITELDPIRWKLGFERFLNPGRRQMPDIDIDFDDRRRSEVIRYVSEKYGEDRVAQIITFSTIKAKQALRDAARVLGFPYSVGDRLAKMYPQAILGKDAPFAACFEKKFEWPATSGANQAFDNAAELRRSYEGDEVSRQVIDAARKLEGLRRQHSVHAAGVVIGREPLTETVPVQRTDEGLVTQYEMGAIETIGLLKIDFLGLRNLTVIDDALAHIRTNRGAEVDIDNLPLDAKEVFELLRSGSSIGVFQMESPGMTRLLKQLLPDRFEEIAALIALYRPGPMDEISRYVKGKHSPSSITYFHDLLKPILVDTNGVIVYQEQVTEILEAVAGFNPQDADMVRYAIGKKKSQVLVKAKARFEEGCKKTGLTDEETQGLWELIRPFAGYSFNRAHASGYGLIAYQTAWLKARYPVEYMAAVLTSVKQSSDRIPIYLTECRSLGIKVRPPSVNESDMDFTPKDEEILFGLSAVRNLGEQVAERIISARRSGDPFSSFEDFVRRVDPSCLNRKVVESLAKSGALDELGVERSELLAPDESGSLTLSGSAAKLIEALLAERRSQDAGQFGLFESSEINVSLTPTARPEELVAMTGVSKSRLLAGEKEMLGFYVSDHPLADVAPSLKYQADSEIRDLRDAPDRSTKTVGGIITQIAQKFTKKGDLYCVGTLEDLNGSIEVQFWPQIVKQTDPRLLAEDRIVLVKGRVEQGDDSPKLAALEVREPDLTHKVQPLRIKLAASACTPDRLSELKGILSGHPGQSPVLLHLTSNEQIKVLKLSADFAVELRGGLFAELKSALGADSLVD